MLAVLDVEFAGTLRIGELLIARSAVSQCQHLGVDTWSVR